MDENDGTGTSFAISAAAGAAAGAAPDDSKENDPRSERQRGGGGGVGGNDHASAGTLKTALIETLPLSPRCFYCFVDFVIAKESCMILIPWSFFAPFGEDDFICSKNYFQSAVSTVHIVPMQEMRHFL